MIHPLCAVHESRLKNLEAGMTRANESLDRLTTHLLDTPASIVAIKTKWFDIHGGGAWVAMLGVIAAIVVIAKWLLA